MGERGALLAAHLVALNSTVRSGSPSAKLSHHAVLRHQSRGNSAGYRVAAGPERRPQMQITAGRQPVGRQGGRPAVGSSHNYIVNIPDISYRHRVQRGALDVRLSAFGRSRPAVVGLKCEPQPFPAIWIGGVSGNCMHGRVPGYQKKRVIRASNKGETGRVIAHASFTRTRCLLRPSD